MPFTMIADRIKYFRALRRKTQVSLASEASIDYRHFQKLEAGQSDFKISTIMKLSEALAIPPCYLLQFDPYDSVIPGDHLCPTGILNQLDVALVSWNLEGKFIFCNKRFSDLIGFPNETDVLKTLNMSNFLPNDEKSDQVDNYRRQAMEGKIKSDFIRSQIRIPNGLGLKKVFAIWNPVLGPRTKELKGFVAAVWEDRECRDLTTLPSHQSSIAHD